MFTFEQKSRTRSFSSNSRNIITDTNWTMSRSVKAAVGVLYGTFENIASLLIHTPCPLTVISAHPQHHAAV